MSWKLMLAVMVATVAAAVGARSAGGTATWDAARAAGFVGYLLLWAACFTGAGVNLRFHPLVGKQAVAFELHRGTAVLSVAFVAGHMAALLLDRWMTFGVMDVLVGFTAGYRPLATGLGAVALWLMVGILVSTAYSAQMPKALWRGLHFFSYLAFAAALAHALLAGSDTEHWPTHVVYSTTTGALLGAMLLRFFLRDMVAPHHEEPGA